MKADLIAKSTPRKRVPGLVLASGLALAVMVPATAERAQACAAGNLAKQAGTAFVSAARSRSPSAFAGALRSHTDLRSISLFALGKYRKRLPKANEGQFVNLTSSYVARTLADFSKKFRAESIEVVRCKGSTVVTKLRQLGGRPAQQVLWRIKGGKIRDVNVQNVWLAQLLRTNFTSVIKKGGGNIGVLFSHLGGRAEVVAKADR